MRRSTVGVFALAVATTVFGSAGQLVAAEHGGPCRGESQPNRRIEAHLVGAGSRTKPKIVLHIGSAANGAIEGKLVLGRGSERISLENWCRIWGAGGESDHDHDSAGDDGTVHEGMVHVLGTETRPDGTQRYIRVDIGAEEGGRIRVMTRSIGHDTKMGGGSDGHGWQSLTGEGWLRLSRMRIGQSGGMQG